MTSTQAAKSNGDQLVNFHTDTITGKITIPADKLCEIVIVLKGRGDCKFAESSLSVAPLDVLVLFPGTAHTWNSSDRLELLRIRYAPEQFVWLLGTTTACISFDNIFFGSHLKNLLLRSAVKFRISSSTLDQMLAEVAAMQNSRNFDHALDTLFVTASFLKMLCRLMDEYWKFYALPKESTSLPPTINRLIERLEQCVIEGKVPNIAQHADEVGMSVQSLNRIFNSHIGTSPFQWFLDCRLRHVKNLLLHSPLDNTEIAYQLGYSDAAHLSRSFKKSCGVTLTQYRSSNRKSAADRIKRYA